MVRTDVEAGITRVWSRQFAEKRLHIFLRAMPWNRSAGAMGEEKTRTATTTRKDTTGA